LHQDEILDDGFLSGKKKGGGGEEVKARKEME